MDIILQANLRAHLYVYGYDSNTGTYPATSGFSIAGDDATTFMDGTDNFVDYSNTVDVSAVPTATVPADGIALDDAYHMYVVWQNPDTQNAAVTFDGIECKMFGVVTPPASWSSDADL